MVTSSRSVLLTGVSEQALAGLSGVQVLVTHPGPAHRDDLMSVALVLAVMAEAYLPAPVIHRHTPTTCDQPGRMYLDIGGIDDPSRLRFDHHQYEKVTVCALTLVLEWLGLLAAARKHWPWLNFSETLDARGPTAAANMIGLPAANLPATLSPVEQALLYQFSGHEQLHPGDPLYEMLRSVGQHHLEQLYRLTERWATLKAEARSYRIDTLRVVDVTAIPGSAQPTLGVETFLAEQHWLDTAIVVGRDERGPGFSFFRRNDHHRVDFRRLQGHPQVHFVHANGFLAKTLPVAHNAIVPLLEQAILPDDALLTAHQAKVDQARLADSDAPPTA